MLLPISLAVVAAAMFLGLQQELSWLTLMHDRFLMILSKWDHPQVSVVNTTRENWDILYHLGGNGPWIPKVDGIYGDELSIPEGCHIEQVHMVGAFLHFFESFRYMLILSQMARHNERYPTHGTAARKSSYHTILLSLALTKLQI